MDPTSVPKRSAAAIFEEMSADNLAKFLQHPSETTPSMPNQNRRIVQVFIADPNENVPLDKALLYRGEQKLTDATDAELFFEVPIQELLAKHNAERVKMLDKEASRKAGKDLFLEPVKIRELKMTVVTIASF